MHKERADHKTQILILTNQNHRLEDQNRTFANKFDEAANHIKDNHNIINALVEIAISYILEPENDPINRET